MAYKVSAIIPVYNEEKFLEDNLKRIVACKAIDEVICINDGSTDTSLAILKQTEGIRLINLSENRGKAYAVVKGVQAAKGDIILFIDADIIGINDAFIKSMLEPLQEHTHDIVLAHPNDLFLDRITIGVTGERAYFKKDLLPLLEGLSKKGYAVELYLNYSLRNKKVKYLAFQKGMRHPYKQEKQSQIDSLVSTYKAFRDAVNELKLYKNPFSFFYYSFLFPYFKK